MENTKDQPLECLSITTLAPSLRGITVTTEKRPNGWYRTVAYVNGSFYAAEGSKDLPHNLREIKKALAQGGHTMPEKPKQIAPEMSARMPKRSTTKKAA
jgi:hypothetical protein